MFSSYTGVNSLYERVYSCFKHIMHVVILGLRANFFMYYHPPTILLERVFLPV